MKIHRMKVEEMLADDILSGAKPFPVRENDRQYQKGDDVLFTVPFGDTGSLGFVGIVATLKHAMNQI